MTIADKQAVYQEMVNSGLTTIETQIPNGPKIKWLRCWDYAATLEGITFKSQTNPPLEHPLLETKEINLAPVHDLKYWQVTIRRSPKPDIKENKKIPY